MLSETGSCWDLQLLAPGVMTLARGWLLLLAFNIDLAQKTLREVPVQPDFEAHEVSVMARPKFSAGIRTGSSIALWVCLVSPAFQELMVDPRTINQLW